MPIPTRPVSSAMNDPEELTSAQVSELEADLSGLRSELESVVALRDEGAKTVELDSAFGRLSRMDAMQQQEMAKATRESHRRRLQLVQVALSEIARGDYGYCARCEEPIGYRRLKAKPESRLCLECQSSSEIR